MASLESKILDGPNAGYCSSSDGEDDDAPGFRPVTNDDDEHQSRVMKSMGGGNTTGAKGVLRDYEDFQRAQKFGMLEKETKARQLAGKGMLSHSAAERDESAREAEAMDESLEALRERRLTELRKAASGMIVELPGKQELLATIEDTIGLLVILLYEPDEDGCAWATHLCRLVASSFPHVRVARIPASTAGMTQRFVRDGVPTLQIYSKGDLVANLVQLHTQIGEDGSLLSLITLLKRKYRISFEKNRQLYDDESDNSDDES